MSRSIPYVVPGPGSDDLQQFTVQNDDRDAPCAACGDHDPAHQRHWHLIDSFRLMLCSDAKACVKRFFCHLLP